MSAPLSDPELLDRVASLRERVDTLGGSDVRIVAVTKGFPASVVEQAVRCGLSDIGESYAQEVVAKAAEIVPEVRARIAWHAIGRLQTRRVRPLSGLPVALWQSVDRPRIVDEVARRAPGSAVLLQVDISGEEQKGGVAPSELDLLLSRAHDAGLEVRGLMGVAADDRKAASSQFRLLRRLADERDLAECSMGMSGDLDLAVEAGSTMIRVGSALFGRRPT